VEVRTEVNSTRAAGAQIVGVLIGPLAFGADLLLSYMFVQHSCSTGHYYVLHVINLVCLAATIAGGFIAWDQYRNAREGSDDGGSALDRSHFLGLLGTASCIFFAVVILANTIPRLILSPCD
jgi:hypothetical protein